MSMDSSTELRRQILRRFGAADENTDELLRYNENAFGHSALLSDSLPLPDELFVKEWQQYRGEVESAGSIAPLRKYLVQLRFPVRKGISQDPDYLAAIRAGQETEADDGGGLQLRAPERCHLVLHPTAAGRIPVLIALLREDFELLVQALSKRNEPVPIPSSMGACMIAGYRNWDRIRRVANLLPGQSLSDRLLDPAVQERLKDKSCYQDRFIILSGGYYSGVEPEEVGLEEQAWRELSIAIRQEHESTHYFTRRVFSSMRNNLLDEIIADYCGIVAALGYFRADWMLRFFGLEDFPRYRRGGRLENYRGTPPVSDCGFTILQKLVKHAADNLAVFEGAERADCSASAQGRFCTLLALSRFTLEELASAEAPSRLRAAFQGEREKYPAAGDSRTRWELKPTDGKRRNHQCAEHST